MSRPTGRAARRSSRALRVCRPYVAPSEKRQECGYVNPCSDQDDRWGQIDCGSRSAQRCPALRLRSFESHAYCSAFTPAAEITFAHLAISSSRNLPASSGVLPTGSLTTVFQRLLMSVEATALPVSAAIRLTISFGVPAGARNSTQVEPSIGGRPASAIVRTSAAPGKRVAENMPSALILPPRTCGISVLGTSTRIWMLPPIRSCSAGAVPLYGTCTMSTPAVCLNSSVVRCAAAPTPEEPKEILPGLALA